MEQAKTNAADQWPPHLELERKQLLSSQIATTLRKAIIDGRLKPGTRLLEQELAKRFHVSRVPLREALRIIEAEGLITIHPHRGAVVTELSDTELVDLFGVRGLLEGRAAAMVAARPSELLLKELTELTSAMKQALRERRLEEYYVVSSRFHDCLVDECGNAVLAKLYVQIRRQLRRYQAAIARIPESPRRSIVEHTELLKAIRAKDPAKAQHAAESHIEALVERFLTRTSKG